MRLADKLLLCSAALYTIAHAFATRQFFHFHSWEHNIFIYLFGLLSVIEYVRLLIPFIRSRKKNSGNDNAA